MSNKIARAVNNRIVLLPCLDSKELAATRKAELFVSRDEAGWLGQTAVRAIEKGYYRHEYTDGTNKKVDWAEPVEKACRSKKSIEPKQRLPKYGTGVYQQTTIQVANETTLQAAKRLLDKGTRPLALNFANGIHPGGGFLNGARAQEECLCRCSALYATLHGDAMYEFHKAQENQESSDWAILSPDVPVFRDDRGTELEEPWLLGFVTCAAPYGPACGLERSGDLLKSRIHRILHIAAAHGYNSLVLGAWGCGAFGLDPQRTAQDFQRALKQECFAGVFSDVIFAIADWSPDRRFLGPFRDVFSPQPPFFLCPLTGKLMTDPVVDREGNTYERSAIEEWLNKNETSPLTKTPMSMNHLVPNKALLEAINAHIGHCGP